MYYNPCGKSKRLGLLMKLTHCDKTYKIFTLIFCRKDGKVSRVFGFVEDRVIEYVFFV